MGAFGGELQCQGGKRWREKDGLIPQDHIGAGLGGGHVIDGKFDHPSGDLTVEQYEGAGYAQAQRQAVIAQAPPQQRPAFVVTEDVLGEAFSA